jgi:CcmD family protein
MTLDYMFWGFLAGFVLIALYVVRLGVRLAGLERRLRDL